MSLFKASNISSGYSDKAVVKDVSFEVGAGEIVGVLGLNGSGKTTLLKSCCNIIRHEGKCELDGEIIEECSTKKVASLCGYLPQQSGISIDMSVISVVLMGFNSSLGMLQYPTAQMKDRAADEIGKVGLTGCENKNYMELSEGQKRLCLLARTMVSESKIIFLDEPDSSLDLKKRYELFVKLKNRVKNDGVGVLTTLHDVNLALEFCDKILLIEDGELVDTINVIEDSIFEIERKMSRVYGENRIIEYTTKQNESKRILVKEADVL